MEEQEQNKLMRTYEILDRRHIHDEGLLINRMANFLLVNSFLVVAFATFIVHGENYSRFSLVLPCVGIVMCLIFLPLLWVQFKTVRIWMEAENEIEATGVFTMEGKGLKPNQRHDTEIPEKSRWAVFWRRVPPTLIFIILGMWVAFLILLSS